MKINDKNVSNYGAELLNFNVENSEIMEKGEFWAESSLTPFPPRQKARYSYVECEFLVRQKNDNEAEKRMSELIALSLRAELKLSNRSFVYKGTLQTHSKEKITSGHYELVLSWKCQAPYEEEKAITITSGVIALESTATTPVVIEIAPTISLDTARITGFGEDITIKNLTLGNKIIIDGEKGVVTEEGQNKWSDYDSWGFPKLKPGKNEIYSDVEIVAKYKPRWL